MHAEVPVAVPRQTRTGTLTPSQLGPTGLVGPTQPVTPDTTELSGGTVNVRYDPSI